MASKIEQPTVFELIEIPDARPAYEFLDGRLSQKVSPFFPHGLVQPRLSHLITEWCDAAGRPGKIASELDIDLIIEGKASRVVPDVVYYSADRVPRDAIRGQRVPRSAPSVAFEISSPKDQWRPRVVRKLQLYREAGWPSIVIVDPDSRSVTVYEGVEERTYRRTERLRINAMPGFEPRAEELFQDLD